MSRRKHVDGKLLRALREEAGFTQAVLASRLGVCRETIVNIENGRVETLRALPIDLVGRWWDVCGYNASKTLKDQFYQDIMDFFKFHVFSMKK